MAVLYALGLLIEQKQTILSGPGQIVTSYTRIYMNSVEFWSYCFFIIYEILRLDDSVGTVLYPGLRDTQATPSF
jgi:hypothetical protein